MAERERDDEPGSLHHICDRGVAQRLVFDDEAVVRYFLSRLVRSYRDGLITIHAYCFRGNHLHLLAGSPVGKLAQAMRNVKSRYVREFNELHDRDGPLFRSRYRSRRVQSDAYLITLLRYIDQNALPTAADAGTYPFGSAHHYLRPDGPKWLSRSLVEGLVMGGRRGQAYDPDAYRRFLGVPLTEVEREVVESRLMQPSTSEECEDNLLTGGTSSIAEWLTRRGVEADGIASPLTLVPPSAIAAVLSEARATDSTCPFPSLRRASDGWQDIHAALLQEICGVSCYGVAALLGISKTSACERRQEHSRRLAADPDYAQWIAAMIHAGLNLTFRPATRPAADFLRDDRPR